MKEKTQSEEYMMNRNDENFFAALQQSLRQDQPEPPAQIDSFIRAAARQQLKKRKNAQNKQFIFWSCGVAAAFAVTFSFLYFSNLQEPEAETGNAIAPKTVSSTANNASTQVADAKKTQAAQEPDWADVMLEITDLSTEINDADMDVSFVAAYPSFLLEK